MLRQVRHEPIFPYLTAYLKEYADITDIHGLRYLVEDRSILEKAFWSLVTVAAFAICLITIAAIYAQQQNNPVYIAPGSALTPIYQVPFPVITICPESRVEQETFSYTKTLQKMVKNEIISNESWEKFQHLWVMCDHYPHENCGQIMFNATKFFQNIDYLKRNLSEILHGCRYFGKMYNCSDIFNPVLTEEGICYSFNSLDRKHVFTDDVYHYGSYGQVKDKRNDYDPDKGYQSTEEDVYPRRTLVTGMDNALEVMMKLETDQVGVSCKSALYGFRVMVHSQFEFARPNQYYYRVSMQRAVIADVKPIAYEIDASATSLSPLARKCYLQSEKKLTYFKVYSYTNCYMECLSNYTFYKCGCVAFYMPRTKEMPICGSGSYKCYKQVEFDIHDLDVAARKYNPELSNICGCLPGCSENKYEIGVSESGWEWRQFLRHPEIEGRLNISLRENDEMSLMKVYIRWNYILKIRRNLMHTTTDILSKLGGLLSLFVGFSIVSFIEVLYFFSARPICNRRMYGSYTDVEKKQSSHG